jgi:branched-chain amino acid transport system permease protein
MVYGLLAATVLGGRVIRPLSQASPNAVIIASLAGMIVLMELVRIAAGARDLWLSPFLNARVTFWVSDGFAVVLTQIQLINTAVMAAIVLAASLLLACSRAGRHWRAVADDPAAARLLGVDADRVMLAARLVTALFSVLAGIMATSYYGSMDFGAGLMFGLKVVMIAAIGDQTAPTRSAMGAAAFGVVETLWGAYLPYVWRDLAMFSLLVVLAVLARRERRI